MKISFRFILDAQSWSKFKQNLNSIFQPRNNFSEFTL